MRAFVLAPLAFAHSAADRLALADARANRVGGRPLAESFLDHMQIIENRNSGGFPESTLQVRHNLIRDVRRLILVEFKVFFVLD